MRVEGEFPVQDHSKVPELVNPLQWRVAQQEIWVPEVGFGAEV